MSAAESIDIHIVVEVFMGAITIVMGALIYMKRDAFRSGKVEGTQSGKAELNSSLITNAIAEIEHLKVEMRVLSDQLVDAKVNRATLTERISNIANQLEEINNQLDCLRKEVREGNKNQNMWRESHR